MLTIIKPRPGDNHGRMRGYSITQVIAGKRRTLDVLALNGRAAIDLVRGVHGAQFAKECA